MEEGVSGTGEARSLPAGRVQQQQLRQSGERGRGLQNRPAVVVAGQAARRVRGLTVVGLLRLGEVRGRICSG